MGGTSQQARGADCRSASPLTADCCPSPSLLPCCTTPPLQIWDAFMESIEPFARHIPYMVGAGNHGARAPSCLCGVACVCVCMWRRGWDGCWEGRGDGGCPAVIRGPGEHGPCLALCAHPVASHIHTPTHTCTAAEYDYEWDFSSSGGGNKAVQADASGEEDPYQPDWGNFGAWGGEWGWQECVKVSRELSALSSLPLCTPSPLPSCRQRLWRRVRRADQQALPHARRLRVWVLPWRCRLVSGCGSSSSRSNRE